MADFPWLIVVFGVLFGVSAGVNLWQFRRHRAARKQPALAIEARDLIHDLTKRGSAVLRVEVIDAANLLLRSPRG